MKDNETVQRFIHYRVQGWTLAKICEELHLCKQTAVNWSRKYRFEIENQRAIVMEYIQNRWVGTTEARTAALGQQLQKVETELAKRDIAELSTAKLISLSHTLRQQIITETGGPLQLTTPVKEIPADELVEEAQTWNA